MQNLKKIMDESWIKLSEDSSVEDGFLQAAHPNEAGQGQKRTYTKRVDFVS